MVQDIEEFLRMAAARKKQQAGQQGDVPRTQANSPVSPRQQASETPPPRRGSSRPPVPQPPNSQEFGNEAVIEQEQIKRLQPTIQSNVSTADIVEHTIQLGEDVYQREEVTDERVHEKFDHNLGQLRKEDISEPELVDHGSGKNDPKNLGPLLKMLSHPTSLRQAIILKEIFDRPEF
ncbi:MAG: hypothetical protein P8M80_09650 [Pirellulaceae bacterium]|nr:hypothetical protein [Pirellulaceae bacterium]